MKRWFTITVVGLSMLVPGCAFVQDALPSAITAVAPPAGAEYKPQIVQTAASEPIGDTDEIGATPKAPGNARTIPRRLPKGGETAEPPLLVVELAGERDAVVAIPASSATKATNVGVPPARLPVPIGSPPTNTDVPRLLRPTGAEFGAPTMPRFGPPEAGFGGAVIAPTPIGGKPNVRYLDAPDAKQVTVLTRIVPHVSIAILPAMKARMRWPYFLDSPIAMKTPLRMQASVEAAVGPVIVQVQPPDNLPADIRPFVQELPRRHEQPTTTMNQVLHFPQSGTPPGRARIDLGPPINPH